MSNASRFLRTVPATVPDTRLDLSFQPAERSDRAGPAQLVAALRRAWPFIAVCGLALGIAAYVGSSRLLPARYTTDGMLEIETQRFAIPELQGAVSGDIGPDPLPQVRSELLVLKSRALLQSVIDDLGLINDPDYNGALQPPSATAKMLASVQRSLPAAVETWGENIGLLKPPAPPEPPTPAMIRNGIVGAVSRDLSLIYDNRSLVIMVQFTAPSAALSAKFVNSLMQHYLASRRDAHSAANREANATLLQRVAEVRSEVDKLDQQIAAKRAQYGLVTTRAGSVGQQQVEDLTTALTNASTERAKVEANWQRAQALQKGGGSIGELAAVLDSPTVSRLRDMEAQAEARSAQLSGILGPSHPTRVAADNQLASARAALGAETRRVVASLGTQLAAAKQREADIGRQLADARAKADQLGGVQADLARLQKDAESRRQLYQQLLGKAEQTTTSGTGAEQIGARVVSAAEPPSFPSSPRPKMAAVLGFASGLAFGGFVTLLRGTRKRGFSTPEEVQAELGLSTLGTVPRVAGRGNAASLAARVAAAPSGPEAEALRLLRTRLRFSLNGAMPRAVLFVSGVAGEGASSIAAAFARVAALDGSRTLLVEGDLQNPSLARVLGAKESDGLVDMVEGRATWRDAVTLDPATPLELLLAAEQRSNAAQQLESMPFQNMMFEARQDYAPVVIDAHPVTVSSDALLLAQFVDVVVLVIEAGATARDDVRRAVESLANGSARPPVVVLNKAT